MECSVKFVKLINIFYSVGLINIYRIEIVNFSAKYLNITSKNKNSFKEKLLKL